MSVTIKQISEISGVSRGTVDRVLHGRGRVSPEKEALVRRVAEQLGYKPNLAGKALAARKKSYTIGVLLTAEGVSFFDEVIRGVRQAAGELADYGITVIVKTIKGYNSAVQLREMEALRHQVNALILNPINEPEIVAEINALAEDGLPVITLNTDVEESRRLCYIGPDYQKSGNHPDLDGLILVAAGSYGVCRAVLELPQERRPKIVAMDCVPTTVEMLRRGVIQATICQQPFTQGYQAVQQAFRYLVQGESPPEERIFMETEIRIRETV